MAYANAVLKNEAGNIVYAPLGFSWPFFFFSVLVPLYRRDFGWAVFALVLSAFTYGVSSIVFSFIYNRVYLEKLISVGYEIDRINDADNNHHEIMDRNPVMFSDYYKEYYVWVDYFGFKFMKYFDDKGVALRYVERYPGRCMSIKYLVLSVKRNASKMEGVKDCYALPLEYWAKNIQTV